MANTADTPFRRWARANFTTSFLYPILVSRAVSCLPFKYTTATSRLESHIVVTDWRKVIKSVEESKANVFIFNRVSGSS